MSVQLVFRDQYNAKSIEPDTQKNTITFTQSSYTETTTSAKVNLSSMVTFKSIFGNLIHKLT